ncbi:unnamed protein product [Microthlaspi erraticum]|uniref:Uncharacterized protein n=1 Tax=Microthlaspi erraticum TaxID=1685480 RepID=A0A6D2LC26_9BRAS|nr:unnamed protein product [Microthlaspi erraticum]
MYENWLLYAIGGSADPIIFSEGNFFVAANAHKQVTKKMTGRWKISTSSKDVFKNGAYFGPSGGAVQPFYKGGESFLVAHGSLVPSLTSSAGVLHCLVGRVC